jgi:hypothetical protein
MGWIPIFREEEHWMNLKPWNYQKVWTMDENES